MPKTKKNDFIEIEFVGRIKDTNQIFDLTDESLAKENKIYNPNAKYCPIAICLGQRDVIPGLDEQLIDKEINKAYTFEISPENAFGKKDPKLMHLVPAKIFIEKNIRPFPGLQINFDGAIGTIRAVSGGRIIVDFNHPLAGRTLMYEIRIIRIIADIKEKLHSILSLHAKEPKFELDNDKLIIHDVPKFLKEFYEKKIRETLPEIKAIEFLPKEEASQSSKTNQPPEKISNQPENQQLENNQQEKPTAKEKINSSQPFSKSKVSESKGNNKSHTPLAKTNPKIQ